MDTVRRSSMDSWERVSDGRSSATHVQIQRRGDCLCTRGVESAFGVHPAGRERLVGREEAEGGVEREKLEEGK